MKAAEVAALGTRGRMRPIRTTTLYGLTAASMRTAHALLESGRTIGNVVLHLELRANEVRG